MVEKKILIIEDDLIDQMAIKRLFKRMALPYPYTLVSSIKNAKKELSEQQFELVISDHNLADGTTFDLLNDLKNIPLILITGNEEPSTVASILENSNAIASFTKDLEFKYIEALPTIIQLTLEQDSPISKKNNNTFTKTNNLIFQKENVTINLESLFKIFDGKKEDVKETIEIFIYNKPREMNDLYQAINQKDGEYVTKIAHRMKSGFRILEMKKQEDLASQIETMVTTIDKKCNSQAVLDAFKQLSIDTKIAIEILQKELLIL